jgi:hypothetical protein
MTKSYTQIPISELRVRLRKLRRQVQSGNLRIVCTHYGELAAFLLPLQDIEIFNSGEGEYCFQKSEEIPLTEFRDQLTESWEKLQSGIDCIYLTFHKRRVVAFISPRFIHHLSLPLIGNTDKEMFLTAEVNTVSK